MIKRITIALFFLIVAARAQDDEPARLRWMHHEGMARTLHEVLPKADRFDMRQEPALSTDRIKKTRSPDEPLPPGDAGRLCLVVDDSIYAAVSNKLLRHVGDLEDAGYSVTTYRFVSGSPTNVRAVLQGLYDEAESLVGAEFFGDIPYIIYEMMQDWDGAGGDPPEYEDFACDLFFMDLNGAWDDVLEDGSVHANNGKYDTWTGDRNLEIWVSRLKTGNLTSLGSETAVMNNYLDKNHDYRKRALAPSWNALVYVDDDWQSMTSSDATRAGYVYGTGEVTSVSAPEGTTASNYKSNRLPVNREFVGTRSHGNPTSHGYYRNSHSTFDYVYNSDYRSIDPPALFYSLFVCSGSDFTANNNLAGTVAFNADSGLLAWGSTKTGGIYSDSSFWQTLSGGGSFGDAFVDWFNTVKGYSYAPRWWYGMVLIGDAGLTTSPQTFVLDVDLPLQAEEGEGVRSGAGTVSLPWALESDLVVSLTSDDPGELAVPASVTITAGAASAVFDLTIGNDLLFDGTQSATVTASAAQWVSASDGMDVLDNEAPLDHFAWSAIDSQQVVNTPFAVTLTAIDERTNVMTLFTNITVLGGWDAEAVAVIPIAPTNTGPFVDGVWTGMVTVTQTADRVFLRASGEGCSGDSGEFRVGPFPDTDGDGLPDAWESLYFGGPTNAMRNGDSDGDGHSNYEEWYAGHVPTNRNSVLELIDAVFRSDSHHHVLSWTSASSRTYRIYWSPGLSTPFSELAADLPATAPRNTYTDTLHGTERLLLYKIGVQRNEE